MKELIMQVMECKYGAVRRTRTRLKLFIEKLLEENNRIPREVLNYEVMARLA
ncbi:hypothetical protein [Paenibacillus jilunlii]|uniref:hypothetical protein n=1 Tax=Paenibacillus jilunlii TaxID=682956 RepID=UPI0012FAC913|nr:hypothetical protein [Paenibacillus jilunlii]